MSTQAFLLVILAGLIHALWNIAAKKIGGDARFAGFTSFCMMIVWAPVGLYFAWDAVPAWTYVEWAMVALSGLLHVLYFVTLLRGYRHADLTVVYPIARGSGPLISSFAAILLLGEQLTQLGLWGMLAVVVGVFLVSGGQDLLRAVLPGAAAAARRQQVLTGISYGLLTGLFIAAYTVLDGYAVKILLISPIVLDYFGNFFRFILLLPSLTRHKTQTLELWRLQWKYALLVATISPIAYVLVLYAMQSAPLSHVAPAREVSMLFAALIGGRLLGEGDRLLRMIGALSIATGVVLLGIGG